MYVEIRDQRPRRDAQHTDYEGQATVEVWRDQRPGFRAQLWSPQCSEEKVLVAGVEQGAGG